MVKQLGRTWPWMIVLSLLARPAGGQSVTLSGPELLSVPAGVGAGVGVAKAAPTVEVALFEGLPDGGKSTLWSSWGDGCLTRDGKYYTTLGNHLELKAGVGHCRVYEYDQSAKALKLVLDFRQKVSDPNLAGGKIHGRLDEGRDGALYFTTYWGKIPKEDDWAAGFLGSGLFRLDPKTGELANLGVPAPKQGLPTTLLDAERMLLYAYAVPSNDLLVYDLAQKKVKHRGGGEVQEGKRNLMVDRAGCVYFTDKEGVLWRYDPQTDQAAATRAKLPGAAAAGEKRGNLLRASTQASKSGVIYGMTEVGRLFAFDPAKETVEDLGPNFGAVGDYTAVMVLSPDGKYVYYSPGSHGSGARLGSPVVQYDVAKKQPKVLCYLNAPLRAKLQYNLGGTYNLKVSADGGTLYGTFNGAKLVAGAKKEVAFGLPCVAVVRVAAEER